MAAIALSALGTFALTADGEPLQPPATQLARAILAYMLLHREQSISREVLLETFWPERDPSRSRASLSTALCSIRRAMRGVGTSEEFLRAGKTTVTLALPVEFDAQEFLRLAASRNRSDRRRALELYRGEFLPGDYCDWTVGQRERLSFIYEELLARTLDETMETHVARDLLERDPYHGRAYSVLINRALDAGNLAGAATLIDRAQSALATVGSMLPAGTLEHFEQLQSAATPVRREFRLPFVGRLAELQLAENALRAKGGRVLLVHGDAGMGKSALLEQIAQLAFRFRRHVISETTSLYPQGFGFWTGIYERLTRRKFAEFLGGGGSDAAEQLESGVLQALAHPGALFIDDAHRLQADARHVTLQIVRECVQRGDLVVLASRPEGVDRWQADLAAVAPIDIALAPLRADELADAIVEAAGQADPELPATLHARTQGHPLFTLRLIDQFVNDGALHFNGLRWHFDETKAQYHLPSGLRSIFEVRLRERGEIAHQVAATIALDPLLTTRELCIVLELEEDVVLDAIDDLLALGILREPDSGPQFGFVHDVVREVAEESLHAGRRIRLHRRIARHLSENPARGIAARRARHLEQSEQRIPAFCTYLDAAEDALASGAWREALALAKKGRSALGDAVPRSQRDPLEVRFEMVRAHAHLAGGEIAQAISRAKSAVRIARQTHEPRTLVEALTVRARAHSLAYETQNSLADSLEAGEIAGREGFDDLYAQALARAAAMYAASGQSAQAIDASINAYEAARRSGDLELALYLLGTMLVARVLHWKFVAASETVQLGEALLDRVGERAEGEFRYNRALYYFLLDRFDEARADLLWAIAHIESGGTRIRPYHTDRLRFLFICNNMLASIATIRGNFDEALVLEQEMLDSPISQGSPVLRAFAVDLRVDTLLARDAPGDAQAAAALLAQVDASVWAREDIPRSAHLGRARAAARLRESGARALLAAALEKAGHEASMQPQDIDRDFLKIAQAAAEIGALDLEERAAALHREYLGLRCLAGGAAWGEGRV
ncbi:MAG: ATP-binding protein [Vulcanimicrobiaceae bacterium]